MKYYAGVTFYPFFSCLDLVVLNYSILGVERSAQQNIVIESLYNKLHHHILVAN